MLRPRLSEGRPGLSTGTEVLTGEAGQILNCSTNHVRYLERVGQLRCRRVGWLRLFQREEVEHLARDRYRKATGQPHFRGNPWELGQR